MHQSGNNVTIRPVASYFELSKSSTLIIREAWMRCLTCSKHPFLMSLLSYGQSNFKVTRGTFKYILHEVVDEISRQDTPLRKAVRGHSWAWDEVVLVRLNFSAGPKKLLLQGKNEAGRVLYWPACQNLGVPSQVAQALWAPSTWSSTSHKQPMELKSV